LPELSLCGCLPRRAIEVVLEPSVRGIHPGPDPARLLQVAPGALGAALGLGHRPVALGTAELRLHLSELPLRQRALVALRRARAAPRRARRVGSGPPGVAQALQHTRDLWRTVFAKNAEYTCSTARDLHFGHAGRRRPCAAIGSAWLKRVRHLVQRYS